MRNLAPSRLALIASFAFFLLLFIPFPLRSHLPGNTDSLIAISLSNLFLEKLKLLAAGKETFTALYPARDVFAYGENCYGLAWSFLIFKLLTSSDFWAYYLFLASLYALNAFGMFKLAGLFVGETTIAWVAGLALAASGFLLSNIDDPNVVFLFFPMLALYFLERGVREKRWNLLRTGFILSGLQIWFGFYIFLFQAVVLALFCLFHSRSIRSFLKLREMALLGLAYLMPAAPLLALYFYNDMYADVISPYNNTHSYNATSYGWNHFWNVLPHGLLYSSDNNLYRALDDSGWVRFRLNGFMGVLFPLFSLVGLFTLRNRFLYSILLLFGTLSFGRHLFSFQAVSNFPFGEYFRVPFRCWMIALIPLSVFFAVGLQRSLLRTKWPWLGLLVGVGVLVENVPASLPSFDYSTHLRPSDAYVGYFANLPKRQIVLDLPSEYLCLAPDNGWLWTFSRDALYMNWQTYHHQITVTGVNSYAPTSRRHLDRQIKQLPAHEAFAGLKEIGITHIVFHKNLVLQPKEDILPRLKSGNELKVALENDDLVIFELL